MARTKKRKKATPQKQKLSLPKLVKKVARNYPFGKVLVNPNWKESGLATIFVSRELPSRKIFSALYLVDIFCLGLKNTSLHHIWEEDEIEARIGAIAISMGQSFVPCDPVLAQNIIYGAIEYAEDLGFSPQKDFRMTQYLLDDVEKIEYMDVEFGKNGRPVYISGPNDDARMVCRQLEKVLGKDNFYADFMDEM